MAQPPELDSMTRKLPAPKSKSIASSSPINLFVFRVNSKSRNGVHPTTEDTAQHPIGATRLKLRLLTTASEIILSFKLSYATSQTTLCLGTLYPLSSTGAQTVDAGYPHDQILACRPRDRTKHLPITIKAAHKAEAQTKLTPTGRYLNKSRRHQLSSTRTDGSSHRSPGNMATSLRANARSHLHVCLTNPWPKTFDRDSLERGRFETRTARGKNRDISDATHPLWMPVHRFHLSTNSEHRKECGAQCRSIKDKNCKAKCKAGKKDARKQKREERKENRKKGKENTEGYKAGYQADEDQCVARCKKVKKSSAQIVARAAVSRSEMSASKIRPPLRLKQKA